uniref:Small ribosomal subunit protein uS15 N-terminal domain-containing protein n=1 Tax=Equus caballus TaxID=9796 RepID=A0A9L0SU71_HORSE
MSRVRTPGKGLSHSALPCRRRMPAWLKVTSDDVKGQIYKLAKKGLAPSQIGMCSFSNMALPNLFCSVELLIM